MNGSETRAIRLPASVDFSLQLTFSRHPIHPSRSDTRQTNPLRDPVPLARFHIVDILATWSGACGILHGLLPLFSLSSVTSHGTRCIHERGFRLRSSSRGWHVVAPGQRTRSMDGRYDSPIVHLDVQRAQGKTGKPMGVMLINTLTYSPWISSKI
ncbi:uncharacterized protein N7459_001991 [Penicillium hispanicum]|uniref:uncharacterized protein n=1 Tax=Penicillium hispanicum TaxID=1080232 RepID=UPI002541C03F|nr:uncharacterized protein N7459_001991 [Penicillium hispanicum]KAJ5591622.1 hypothetical protein N7459_001991 [Penicillium hispanicum]